MIFFVTGGSRGVGAAVVAQAARAGHDVAFTYLTGAKKAAKAIAAVHEMNPAVTCRAYAMDVGDPESIERTGDQVLSDFGTVHVVVNNAGVNRDNLAAVMTNEEWDLVLRINLTGPFFVCRYFLPTLLGNKFGRVINISSLAAYGASGQVNYSAAKAGLHGMTQTLAKEYGRKGITANVLVLGLVDTDMTRETMSESVRQFWTKYCPHPKGRMATPTEVSELVTFLASEGASFVNGQVINVSGGLDWGP